jgi:Domain of unknown function (DUF4926)
MINELDVVALTKPLLEHGLVAGDIGTVVMAHDAVAGHGPGFTVEFMTLKGATIAIATLPADAIRPIGIRDMAHVREIVGAAQ